MVQSESSAGHAVSATGRDDGQPHAHQNPPAIPADRGQPTRAPSSCSTLSAPSARAPRRPQRRAHRRCSRPSKPFATCGMSRGRRRTPACTCLRVVALVREGRMLAARHEPRITPSVRPAPPTPNATQARVGGEPIVWALRPLVDDAVLGVCAASARAMMTTSCRCLAPSTTTSASRSSAARRFEGERVLARVDFDRAARCPRPSGLPVHCDRYARHVVAGRVLHLEHDRRHRLRNLVETLRAVIAHWPWAAAETQIANCTRASRSLPAWRRSWPDSLAAMHSAFVGAGSAATADLAAITAAAARSAIRAARNIPASTSSSRSRGRARTAGYSWALPSS